MAADQPHASPAAATVAPVPVHPESVPDDTRSLRWSMSPGTLGFVGRPDRLPDELGALLGDGILESVTVEPAAVRTRLGEGLAWRAHGPAVRRAVQRALATPDAWVAPTGATHDDVLRAAAREVIEGQVGDYVRSHGGTIEIVDVGADRIAVSMSGACSHCPASEFTLTQRFEVTLRELYPRLREVSAAPGSPTSKARALLGLSVLRRRLDRTTEDGEGSST